MLCTVNMQQSSPVGRRPNKNFSNNPNASAGCKLIAFCKRVIYNFETEQSVIHTFVACILKRSLYVSISCAFERRELSFSRQSWLFTEKIDSFFLSVVWRFCDSGNKEEGDGLLPFNDLTHFSKISCLSY